MNFHYGVKVVLIALLTVFMTGLTSGLSDAASARVIDARVDETLEQFRDTVTGADEVLSRAKGVLVMPRVYKAGLGFGGEYGEGALRINGQTVDYYNIVSASWGFQLGAQRKSLIIVFLEDAALRKFQDSQGWEVGVDASVALVKVGAEGSISSKTLNQPVVGFVIGHRGLMYDLSLEGSKFTKISK